MNNVLTSKNVEQNNIKAIITNSYNRLYSRFTSQELTEVGNYKILKQIGEGSFGKVYLASHKLTHHRVVLKTGDKFDPNVVREVFYHRQFDYPYITKLYEVIVTESKVWMALEYCPNRELYDYLLQTKRIPVSECKELFSQIAGAVYYAHSFNCVHRDLKLENILLDENRNSKLTDFGFTRECMTRTVLETMCGTTIYMAPELIEKRAYDGFKIDVWALGIILYTMLTGVMPFDGESETNTKWKIVHEMPVFDDKLLSKDATRLLTKMLEKNPAQRPSVQQVLRDNFLQPYGMATLEMTDRISQLQRGGHTHFNSKAERRTLKRLRQLGFDTHAIKNSVLKKKCDSLSGLWFLLLEESKKRDNKGGVGAGIQRSRSVLSVKKMFENTKLRDSMAEDGFMRTSLDLTGVSSIGRALSKGASLSPLVLPGSKNSSIKRVGQTRSNGDKITVGSPTPSGSVNGNSVTKTVNTNTTSSNASVSIGDTASLPLSKSKKFFRKFSKFFKKRQLSHLDYIHQADSLQGSFSNSVSNSSTQASKESPQRTMLTPSVSQSEIGTGVTKLKKPVLDGPSEAVERSQSNPLPIENPRILRLEGDDREPSEPDLKHITSIPSSGMSTRTSSTNYDNDTFTTEFSATRNPRRQQLAIPARPRSNVSEFSNETSDYSIDGSSNPHSNLDFSHRSLGLHTDGQYFHSNVPSDKVNKGTNRASRRFIRRDVSIRSETSSTSDRSSRTNSFYDITTATNFIPRDMLGRQRPNFVESVLPRFGTNAQMSTWKPGAMSTHTVGGYRGKYGGNRRWSENAMFGPSGSVNVIREEPSSIDDERSISFDNSEVEAANFWDVNGGKFSKVDDSSLPPSNKGEIAILEKDINEPAGTDSEDVGTQNSKVNNIMNETQT